MVWANSNILYIIINNSDKRKRDFDEQIREKKEEINEREMWFWSFL